jgi:hypothetical protein
MTIRVYVLPMTETLVNGIIYRAPKYLGGRNNPTTPGLEGIQYNLMDYGFQPVCILVADVTTAQHAIFNTQSDVLKLPVNLDNTLTSTAVTSTKNFLETIHIPANWVTTAFTYRQILRLVGWLFQFMQRLHGIYPTKLFDGVRTLSTQYGSLSPEWQVALVQCGQSFGFNTSALTSTTTLRTILKYMADQFGNTPLNTGMVTF